MSWSSCRHLIMTYPIENRGEFYDEFESIGTGSGAGNPQYGRPGGHAQESRDSKLLSAFVSGGKGKEAPVDGLQAEAAHDSQCDREEWDALAGRGQSVGLIFKTVADPEKGGGSFLGRIYLDRLPDLDPFVPSITSGRASDRFPGGLDGFVQRVPV